VAHVPLLGVAVVLPPLEPAGTVVIPASTDDVVGSSLLVVVLTGLVVLPARVVVVLPGLVVLPSGVVVVVPGLAVVVGVVK